MAGSIFLLLGEVFRLASDPIDDQRGEIFQYVGDVEHEMRLVAQGDWVVDIGPGAGRDGGKIVAEGRPEEVANAKAGRTAGVFGEGARPREGSDRAEGCGTAAVIADRESFSDFAMSYCVRESVSITLAVSPKPEKAPFPVARQWIGIDTCGFALRNNTWRRAAARDGFLANQQLARGTSR